MVKSIEMLSELFRVQVVTMGKSGVLVATKLDANSPLLSLFSVPPLQPAQIINTNGAGDSFVGAFLALLANNSDTNTLKTNPFSATPQKLAEIAFKAQRASILSLGSHSAISDKICPDLFQ
ncbi:hypothetical protein AYI68_g2738 [Smittium mucronatum]|nr:hypothetical protein AYI68_g2738 [Smittium mucronatum]